MLYWICVWPPSQKHFCMRQITYRLCIWQPKQSNSKYAVCVYIYFVPVNSLFSHLSLALSLALFSNYSVKRSIKLKCWMLTLIKECSIFHYKCKQTVGSPATMWELLLLLMLMMLLLRPWWRRGVAAAATAAAVAGDGFCVRWNAYNKSGGLMRCLFVCSLVHSQLKSKHAPVHIFIKSNHIN